jgi:hypothetical protein
MPISLGMPPEEEDMIKRVAAKAGKTKTALILEAVDERLGLVQSGKISSGEWPDGCLTGTQRNSGRS